MNRIDCILMTPCTHQSEVWVYYSNKQKVFSFDLHQLENAAILSIVDQGRTECFHSEKVNNFQDVLSPWRLMIGTTCIGPTCLIFFLVLLQRAVQCCNAQLASQLFPWSLQGPHSVSMELGY